MMLIHTENNKKQKRLILSALILALIFILASCSGLMDWFNSLIDDEFEIKVRGDSRTSTAFVPHLISEEEREENPYRYIEDDTKNNGTADLSAIPTSYTSANAVNSALKTLLNTVTAGKRPIVSSDADNPVTMVYNAALTILNSYMLNDFTEYERVHTIYDWICFFIDYDHDLLDEYMENNGLVNGNNPAFHLSGALLSGLAVCDGISQTFSLLCAMEGIEVERVLGWYPSEDENGDTVYVGHAWNKVNIEVPDENISGKNWFFVDPTFGSAPIWDDGIQGYLENLTHAYFLLTDEQSSDHYQDDWYICNSPYTNIIKKATPSKATYAGGGNAIYSEAVTEFDYYATQSEEYEDKTYTAVITSFDAFADYLLNYAIKKRMEGVEVRLDFDFDYFSIKNFISSNLNSSIIQGYYGLYCGMNDNVLMLAIYYK